MRPNLIFATLPLLALLDWLTVAGCTHVAIESTGGYWRPVFNILEGDLEVILVNARHVKAVPGRKTDVKDCEWLADLLRHGLLKASFIPPVEIRELRELTRYRRTPVREQASVANRVQRIIESGNIKLAQVATDALGVSGWQMLRALAQGESDATKLAEIACGRLRGKKVELQRALRFADPISSGLLAECGIETRLFAGHTEGSILILQNDGEYVIAGDSAMGPTAREAESADWTMTRPPIFFNGDDEQLRRNWTEFEIRATTTIAAYHGLPVADDAERAKNALRSLRKREPTTKLGDGENF